MIKKKRFGISIPYDMADDLDRLAKELKCDRSSLVAEALRTFIHDHLHYITPHKCRGVIIVFGENGSDRNLIEEFREIILSYNHYHMGKTCIETLIVDGDSSKIRELHSRLINKGCNIRYIPVANQFNREHGL